MSSVIRGLLLRIGYLFDSLYYQIYVTVQSIIFFYFIILINYPSTTF